MTEEYWLGTPEAVDIGYEVAGIGSRCAAGLVDLLVAGVLMFLVVMGSIGLMNLPDPGPTIGVIALISLGFLLFWGYFIVFETLWSGQTPGKRVLGVRVIRTSGYPIGFVEAAIRNLVRIVDWLPGFYGIGVITMFLSPRSRRLGDLAAGTLVVKERPRVRASDLQRVEPAVQSVTASAPLGALDPEELEWNLRALSPEDLQMVRGYLARVNIIDKAAGQRIGHQIADVVAERIGAREPFDPVPFLRRVLTLYDTES